MPKTMKKSQKYKGSKSGGKRTEDENAGLKKIKSAKEMGLKAESLGIVKKTKTHKGRKIIENRE